MSEMSFPASPEVFIRCRFTDERDHVAATIDHFGLESVIRAVVAAVDGPDGAAASDALGFVRDLVQMIGHDDFRHAYYHSELLDLIRARLYAPVASTRRAVVYTLGKLGPSENARYLGAAVPWYIEHDPLSLAYLLWEHAFRLTDGWRLPRRREALTPLVISTHYMTRWAAVDIIRNEFLERSERGRGWGSNKVRLSSPGWAAQFMRRLAQDRHPWIRDEARWALSELLTKKAMPRRARTPILLVEELGAEAVLGPHPFRFTDLKTEVGNYLWSSGEPDYDLDLITDVVSHLHRHPFPQNARSNADVRNYWLPLMQQRNERPTSPRNL